MMVCSENTMNTRKVMFMVVDSLELSSKCNKELGRLKIASEQLSAVLDILELDNKNSSSSSGGDEMMRGVVRVRVLASRAVLYEEMERWGDVLEEWAEVWRILEKGGAGGGMEMKQRALLGRGRAKKFVTGKKYS